ncbi:MAG: ATP-dependent 6-phosphofructokinase [Candidatus Kariarchaeaceae archaeon]|jgi:6-phosphofructokinase 1
MKKIGIATTGGDAPGMNAAIRAITRLASAHDIDVIGFEAGWDGLFANRYQKLTKRSVGGILHQGGTILRTSRSKVLHTEEGREKCAENLLINDIDGFFVIGGNGSMMAANLLSQHISHVPFIGIPGSIDNDVFGTDETFGFDSAVNTAVGQIDKIRDTAQSHDRIFITEVMGRKHGFIALDVGIAVGASYILVPEEPAADQIDDILATIRSNQDVGKKSGIIVAAEGVDMDCRDLASVIERQTDTTVRINILGYSQRGGSPTARSRLLATLYAKEGVRQILENPSNQMMGLTKGEIVGRNLDDIVGKERVINMSRLQYYRVLAS